jgi:ParB/RepB/Spo0J family partition protein
MSSQLKTVPIGLIRENQIALRSVNKESEAYKGLRDSIGQMGIMNSINVRPSNDVPGTYELVDGLHRYTAAKELGNTEVPVNVLDINEGQVALAQIMANVHKIETRPVEYSQQLVRILTANPTWTINELATKLARSPAWLSERLNLTKLDPDIAALVDDSKINLTNAYVLAKLPQAEQKAFLDNAIAMPPTEFGPTVQARVKELRDAARQGRQAAPVGFVPIQAIRKMGDIKAAVENPVNVVEIVTAQGFNTPADIVKATLAWVVQNDPASLARQKDSYDAREKEKADAKAKREAERKAKKDKEAAEIAATVTGQPVADAIQAA